MKITTVKAICPQLLALFPEKRKIKSRSFALKVLDTKQEEVFRTFLTCLYDQRSSKYKNVSKRMFRAFFDGFENLQIEEKRQFSDPFHKEIQKVFNVYAQRDSSLDPNFASDAFRLQDLDVVINELKKDDYKLATRQETDVNRISAKNKHIRHGLIKFQQQNITDYPHSVIELKNCPKMVIIGTPRYDRTDTLNRFFSIMIKEEVEVIVALNTASDWEGAIAYHAPEHVEQVKIDGFSIAYAGSWLLYEGHTTANMPEVIQDAFQELPETRQQEYLAQYRPRIIERRFLITDIKKGKERTLTQLHYENWPDRQEAPDLDAWWVLLRRQLELQTKSVAIHCQGGIGRTNVHAILTCLVSELNALKEAHADLKTATFNVPLTMYLLKQQAPRLGGLVCGKRFAQIYELLLRYYLAMLEKKDNATIC